METKPKKKGRKAVVMALIVLLLLTMWFAFCGYQWSWGPFFELHNYKMLSNPGNAEEYSLANIEVLENSPIKGKRILFLGSSITYGTGSVGVSFADYICQRNDAIMIKEAVAGTTLIDNGANSYISRMKRLDPNMQVDLFVCQLSTNDGWKDSPLGEVCESNELQDLDTGSITGAIEYIIAYVRQTWDCPVVFYTNSRFEGEKYDLMVTRLHEVAQKWDVIVIDMWNDDQFNDISAEQKKLYMADDIHPAQAGYLKWWVPYMEPYLYAALDE